MPFCFILKYKITLFYLLSFVFNRFINRCHSLSLNVNFCYSFPFVVNRYTTRCQSFYHSLSLAVIRFHSLSLALPLVVTRCHLLYHSLSLVVTCCTTRLSFYKRSFSSIDLLDAKDVKFQKKFDRW